MTRRTAEFSWGLDSGERIVNSSDSNPYRPLEIRSEKRGSVTAEDDVDTPEVHLQKLQGEYTEGRKTLTGVGMFLSAFAVLSSLHFLFRPDTSLVFGGTLLLYAAAMLMAVLFVSHRGERACDRAVPIQRIVCCCSIPVLIGVGLFADSARVIFVILVAITFALLEPIRRVLAAARQLDDRQSDQNVQ